MSARSEVDANDADGVMDVKDGGGNGDVSCISGASSPSSDPNVMLLLDDELEADAVVFSTLSTAAVEEDDDEECRCW